MRKRAQAAMEFLMTYGWALLVVLIAISALAFFGILNPGKFLPSNCNLGVGFSCVDYKISSFKVEGIYTIGPSIDINVQNGIGKVLDAFAIYVDTNALKCGGWYGIISLPILAPTPFGDGESRPIKTYLSPYNPNGIVCGDYGSASGGIPNSNCCSFISASAGAYFGGVDYGCETSYVCSTVTLTRGTKFKADLVIIYKEMGSSLVHKRVGQIVAQVE